MCVVDGGGGDDDLDGIDGRGTGLEGVVDGDDDDETGVALPAPGARRLSLYPLDWRSILGPSQEICVAIEYSGASLPPK